MELRQLEYFVVVAEEASFTRAAGRLFVTQPGVSAQIRQLELELGEALLDRSTRSVRLTEVGAAVLPYARAALAAATGAQLTVDEMSGQARGRVAVGTVAAFSSFDLPDTLASFHRRYPGIELTLADAPTDDLVAALRTRQLDAGFVGLTAADTEPRPGIATLVVREARLVAVSAPGDPVLADGNIELAALRDRGIVGLRKGTGLRTALDDACTKAGFQPQIAFEASDPHLVAQLAARGLGVAVLPAAVAAAHRDEVRTAAIHPRLWVRIALAWRSESPISPATRAFIGHVRAAVADPAWSHPAGPRP